jgi:hypothetical protein
MFAARESFDLKFARNRMNSLTLSLHSKKLILDSCIKALTLLTYRRNNTAVLHILLPELNATQLHELDIDSSQQKKCSQTDTITTLQDVSSAVSLGAAFVTVCPKGYWLYTQ